MEKGIKVKDFYDHILKHMTAEEALMKLLEGPLRSYEKLKFDENGQEVHPVLIISAAAMDLGWNFAVEKGQEHVRGLCVGTQEYIDTVLKSNKEQNLRNLTERRKSRIDININPHLILKQTATQFLEDHPGLKEGLSDEVIQKMGELNSFVRIHLYVGELGQEGGLISVFHYDVDLAIVEALRILDERETKAQ